MNKSSYCLVILLALTLACGQQNMTNSAAVATTPARVTDADVAKLKWLEGTWKGMDGDKPFYERYRFEGSSMVVESLKDEKLEVDDADRFELVNGEFGKGEDEDRSAISEITDNSVQF